MNKVTIVLLSVGTIAILFASLYFSSTMMPFGMGSQETDVLRDHSDELTDFEIGPGEAVQKMQSAGEVVILDLRTLGAYEEMHIQNALLLPAKELSQKTLSEIGIGLDKKDNEIILYDISGSASKTVYNIMTAMGYSNVKSVSGGMVHWQEDEYPMLQTGEYTGPVWSNVNNSSRSDQTGGPKVIIDRNLHDFGEIPQYGGVVQAEFYITNDGNEILEVGDITTSCSCTSAVISNSSIDPGNSATLTVILDPDLHAEPPDVFRRTVFIPTNDPETPEAEVAIQVDILEGE